MTSLLALPGESGIYSTSKFAVLGLSEALRLSLVKYRIGVSLLCPGLVKTNIMGDGPGEESLFAFGEGALDPMPLGQLVLDAIVNDQPFIFPNGEFREGVRDVQNAILDYFPEGPFPAARLEMEAKRVAMIEAYRRGLC